MKRNSITIKTSILLAAFFCTLGCKKITDINVSPNNPALTAGTPQVLFPAATQSTAGRVGGELAIIGGIWSQYWTQANSSNQFKDIDAYQLNDADLGSGSYNELFAGALADYQLAITQAKTQNQLQYLLMGTVMKAYTYEVLVDLYDKVPYTEAFQGQANLQPKFDDGFTVYKGLLAEIDAALAATANTGDLLTVDQPTDFVFNGSMDSWRAFANTLELKMYLRMVNTQAATAQAGIQKLLSSNAAFLTVDAQIGGYVNTLDLANPLYDYNQRLNTPGNLRASKTFVSWLEANKDPRIVDYFGSTSPVPINQGDFNATAAQQPTYANATIPVMSATAPVPLITASESYFLQAEAAERYNGGTNAKTLFDAGVTAAFAYYSETAPTDTAFQYPAAGATFQQKLRRIIINKWASFPGSHALEGFFDQERTGYPQHSPVYSSNTNYADLYPGLWVYSAGGVTSGKFPKRLVFPFLERTTNKNTPAEVPITTPVWWGLTNN